MMRTKHKIENTLVQNGLKKQKSTIEPAPLPTHITIKNNNVLYHFNELSTATQFRDITQGNLSAELFSRKMAVTHTRCEYGKNHRNCQIVSITPDQFDYLVGSQKIYLEFLKIYKALIDGDMKSTRAQLIGMNPKLANQAALLMDENDGCLFLEWIYDANEKNEDCNDVISFFIPLLNPEMINRLALKDRELARLTPSIVHHYIFDHLTPETCNEIARHSHRFLDIIQHVKDQDILSFFKKLHVTTFNQIALIPTSTGEYCIEVISKYCQNNQVLAYFVSQLTPETCEQLNTTALINFQKFSDEKTYKSFVDKLRPTSKINRVLTIDLKQKDVSTYAVLTSLSILAKHPNEVEELSKKDPHLDTIDFWDRGRSQDSWSKITRKIITQVPAPSVKKKEHDLSFKLDHTDNNVSLKSLGMHDIQKKEWHYLRMQGRTILLANSAGEILAVKIQKKFEKMNDLLKEFQTTSYLKSNAQKFDLKSRLPTPIDVISLKEIFSWLASVANPTDINTLKEMIGNSHTRIAYLYTVNPKECDYFTYLHNPILPRDIFNKVNRDVVHDLFMLLQNGVVFPQLADIFHNSEHTKDRQDKGRYIVLVNLLNNWNQGSGRITGWREAVNYPNVRASGIGDLGDRISVNDLIKDSEFVRQFYSKTQGLYGDKTGNFLLANVMAEYQYILFLIAGRRGYELTQQANKDGQSSEDIKKIWQDIANQIIDNCAQAVSILTKSPENQVKMTLTSIVSADRLGSQMQYWMTEDYIQDVSKNRVRQGVYGSMTRVNVDIKKFRNNTFNLTQGCSIDGTHSDLGPVNGQEPIKEANKLFYWMVTQIFAEYEKLHTTLKVLHEITSTKNVKKSESLRKQSFLYLPKKAYHAMQYTLCNERLKQSLSDNQRKSLLAEAEEHKKNHAVSVIQNYLRNHTVKR